MLASGSSAPQNATCEAWPLTAYGTARCGGSGSHEPTSRTYAGQLRLLEPALDPHRPLPHMLDFFRLRFAVDPGS